MDYQNIYHQLQPIYNANIQQNHFRSFLHEQESYNELERKELYRIESFIMLDDLRKRNILCDVILETECGFSIPAHKIVLTASSSYFHAMFTNFKERNHQRIKIKGVDHIGLDILINYIYTHHADITTENVQSILEAADLLQFVFLRESCWEFIQRHIQSSNCLGVRALAELYDEPRTLFAVKIFIELNFWQMIEEDEFKTLTKEQLIRLISSDCIAVPSEETIVESIMLWINANLNTRKNDMKELAMCIRLPFLSRNYLGKRASIKPSDEENLLCKNILIEAVKYDLLRMNYDIFSKRMRARGREPFNAPKVLLVVGGEGKENVLCSVEYYDFIDDKWYQSTDLSEKRGSAGLINLDQRIYLIGGWNGHIASNTIDIYDRYTNEWLTCTEMPTKRISPGVVDFNSYIYTIGGSLDERNSLNSAEVYDTLTNMWYTIAPMRKKRDLFGLCVIDGFLYAVGGFDHGARNISSRYLSSIERYNPVNNSWELISNMAYERCGVAIGVINGIIYAIGGQNRRRTLKTCEAFSTVTNTWRRIASLLQPRENAAIVTYNELLYVIGGNNGSTYLSSVEIYSPAADSWMVLPNSMNIPRNLTGAVLVNKLQAPIISDENTTE